MNKLLIVSNIFSVFLHTSHLNSMDFRLKNRCLLLKVSTTTRYICTQFLLYLRTVCKSTMSACLNVFALHLLSIRGNDEEPNNVESSIVLPECSFYSTKKMIEAMVQVTLRELLVTIAIFNAHVSRKVHKTRERAIQDSQLVLGNPYCVFL